MKILQSLPRRYVKRGFDWIAVAANIPKRGAVALRYVVFHKREQISNIAPAIAESISGEDNSFKNMSFTFAAISLSAMVAQIDGEVSQEEYLAFRDSFPLTGGMCGKIRQLFDLACQSQIPASLHISQIKVMFPDQVELYTSLVDRLFRIAIADKPLTREEEKLLAKIAHSLDITPAEYSALYDRYSRPLAPHTILGLEKRSHKDTIKQRYHTLMNRYHPDRYASIPTSPEVQMLLTLKSAEITQAYRSLTQVA